MHLSWIVLAAGLVAAGDQGQRVDKKSAPSACDLAGSYRLRFRSNGQDGWWFRFNVEAGRSPAKAMLVEDVEVLGLKSGPLTLTPDPVACRFTLSKKGHAVGNLAIAIDLDTKTDTLTGKLTRTKAIDEAEKHLVVGGVRDRGAARSGPACITPGFYEVEFDPKARWRNADKGDKRSCKQPLIGMGALILRIEPYGKTVAVGKRASEPPYKEAWATDQVTMQDDCNVTAKIEDAETTLEAKLTFADGQVTGTAIEVTHQVIEGDEDIWNCVARKVPLTMKRVQE